MKHVILVALGAALASSALGYEQKVQDGQFNVSVREKYSSIAFEGTRRLNAPKERGALVFTADVPEAHTPVWLENFDTSLEGWKVDETENVTWSLKGTSAEKAFSQIDPEDRTSLFVEGPYKVYLREISSATSSEITVPWQGSLQGYVGYSLNYDDMCRLVVSVSDDDFETSTEVWNSKDGEGGKAWQWRHFTADLSPWAGKSVKVRLTYTWGSSDEIFKTGGYMGDFYIDGLRVSGLKPVEKLSVDAGEKIRLICLNQDAHDLRWTMPGAVPAESAETSPEIYYTAGGNYDITLEATLNGEELQANMPGYVDVTGVAPVARILPPATFRFFNDRNYMVAPLAPVTFTDASAGFPTESAWVFSGLDEDDATATTEISEPDPTVSFMYQHAWPVGLTVSNETGSSSDLITVSAEFEGGITNTVSGDNPTNFDMGDWGVFPGCNTHKITRYAERFSKPSVPMVVGGAFVYFTDVPNEIPVTENSPVGVHLYTSVDGVPGERVESMWWDVIDLDSPSADGTLRGTWFEFSSMPVVHDEFFIVVDGLPEYSETCKVAFTMAGFRDSGNTALMEIDGVWKEVDQYFGAGHCTSYFITPVVRHSVMTSLPVGDDELNFNPNGGELKHSIFSYMGYKTPVQSDADWCRVVSEPNGMTVDELTVQCDPNPGSADREAHLTLTDGVGSLTLTVRQSATSGIKTAVKGSSKVYPALFSDSLTVDCDGVFRICDIAGRCVYEASIPGTIDTSSWPSGMYIVVSPQVSVKVLKR